jgi:plasmid stabilization system protein ParE
VSLALEFLPDAAIELEEATRFYEEQMPGLGLRYRLEVENACVALVRDPLIHRERAGGFRRTNLHKFPYYIAYFIRGECMFIAAVAHASRHPDYWKNRLV